MWAGPSRSDALEPVSSSKKPAKKLACSTPTETRALAALALTRAPQRRPGPGVRVHPVAWKARFAGGATPGEEDCAAGGRGAKGSGLDRRTVVSSGVAPPGAGRRPLALGPLRVEAPAPALPPGPRPFPGVASPSSATVEVGPSGSRGMDSLLRFRPSDAARLECVTRRY